MKVRQASWLGNNRHELTVGARIISPSHQRGRSDFVGAVTRTAHHNILGREELTGYPLRSIINVWEKVFRNGVFELKKIVDE
jgi:hypothetical protein